MPLNGLDVVLGNGLDLIPHIEEAAFSVIRRDFAMPQLVQRFTDMTGWNERKVSEYLQSRRAVELAEDTAIPDTKLVRARKNVVSPKEVGDRYRVSDRRADTDLENILSDITEALAYGVGAQLEFDLIKTGLEGFRGGTLGGASTDYSVDLPISAMYEFTQRARKLPLVNVVHPYQVAKVLKDLMNYQVGTNLDYRNEAVSNWRVPTVGNVSIVVSDTLPRRIVNKLSVFGTGGTFRLALNSGQTIGEDVTAAITVSTTVATMVANIKSALEALTFDGNGTWTVAGGANIQDITITPPTTLYLDAESELRIAVNYSDPTASEHKSAYDLVTTVTGGPLDQDGDMMGVQIYEKSATCKSLFFARGALVLDVRKPIKTHYELVHQGRTAEYSMYTTYGTVAWRPEYGMFIETKATSSLAVS
jgi:hypothetical protein